VFRQVSQEKEPAAGSATSTGPVDGTGEAAKTSPSGRKFRPDVEGLRVHNTPADVHYGRAEAIREQRGVVLLDAYAKHPERFVRKIPTPPVLPVVAWINQPEEAANSLNR